MTNQELYDLITRFENSSLHTMKLSTGDFSVELSKGGVVSSAGASTPSFPKAETDDTSIVAPLVGTFYAAPAPGKPPFVSVGEQVKRGQTVCLIEAMKMISEVPAPCDCIITELLKENGSLAAFGEPLFRYQPC